MSILTCQYIAIRIYSRTVYILCLSNQLSEICFVDKECHCKSSYWSSGFVVIIYVIMFTYVLSSNVSSSFVEII